MATISLGRFTLVIDRSEARQRLGPSLVQRLRAWMLHRRSMADLRGADARTCRDLGIDPSADTGLARRFGVDPAPLWGIGEVPMPRPEAPRRRR